MSGTGAGSPLLAIRAVEGYVPAVIETGLRGLVLETAGRRQVVQLASPRDQIVPCERRPMVPPLHITHMTLSRLFCLFSFLSPGVRLCRGDSPADVFGACPPPMAGRGLWRSWRIRRARPEETRLAVSFGLGLMVVPAQSLDVGQ